MKKQALLFLAFVLIIGLNCFSQISQIKGYTIDAIHNEPIPYTSIFIIKTNKAFISNENGVFTINPSNLKNTDSIKFECIGYKTKKISLQDLKANPIIKLRENVNMLDEIVLLGGKVSAESIVKGVLKNKGKNYASHPKKNLVFIRERTTNDFNEVVIDYKKSSISVLDRKNIEKIEKELPRHSLEYSDYLGYEYSQPSKKKDNLKIATSKFVKLRVKEFEAMDILKSMDSILKSSSEKEYWKVKSGIFGIKIPIDKNQKNSIFPDSVPTNQLKEYLRFRTRFKMLENDNEWEFLHKTSRYKYTLVGSTSLNSENIYIIDFIPTKKGLFEGRLYISSHNYALVKASFAYAPNKKDKEFKLFGIHYVQTNFKGNIYFEKNDQNQYNLKYFSYQVSNDFDIDRKLALQKKKDRFLFDKTIDEVKVDLKVSSTNITSYEYLTLSTQEIDENTFKSFVQPSKTRINYIDTFSPDIWKGYPVIEATKEMKKFKTN